MAPRPRIAALLALLHAQRAEVDRRAIFERASDHWLESSARLDEINAQIMHVAEFGAPRREAIGSGHELDLDSRPEGDVAFRRCVVDSLRAAMRLEAPARVVGRSTSPLLTAEEVIARAQQPLEAAQADIRARYPRATVTGTAGDSGDGVEANLFTVQADRDGRVA